MIRPALASKRRAVGASLAANLLLSWLLLPLVLPPNRMYSLRELFEVVLWQGIGAIGWPLALLGGSANLLLQGRPADVGPLVLVLIYPISLFLLVLVLGSARHWRWALVILHILISLSFAAIWRQVLNGYDFMIG